MPLTTVCATGLVPIDKRSEAARTVMVLADTEVEGDAVMVKPVVSPLAVISPSGSTDATTVSPSSKRVVSLPFSL